MGEQPERNSMSNKIKVHVRMKKTPESLDKEQSIWFIKENLLHQRLDEEKSMSYLCYESIFHEENNLTVFDKCIRDGVESVFDGKSLTVFAYGQTGSGKTYTMTGTKEDPGLLGQ